MQSLDSDPYIPFDIRQRTLQQIKGQDKLNMGICRRSRELVMCAQTKWAKYTLGILQRRLLQVMCVHDRQLIPRGSTRPSYPLAGQTKHSHVPYIRHHSPTPGSTGSSSSFAVPSSLLLSSHFRIHIWATSVASNPSDLCQRYRPMGKTYLWQHTHQCEHTHTNTSIHTKETHARAHTSSYW